MILSDRDIKAKIASGAISITPYDESLVQPASVDIHLDNDFKIFRPHKTEVIDPKKPVDGMMEHVTIEDGDAFILHPGTFALGLIKEETGVDAQHVGRLEGKSSLARLGLIIHTTAGFLDPGNKLQMTLELFNASPLPIKLYPGMKIAQMAFEEISSPCEKPYGSKGLNSKYYGAKEVQASQMHKNFK
jgi:dCTP deaminase